MTESTRCFRYEDYTVGWISAIPVELEAAIQMLDQRHYDLPQSPNGSIIYTLGSIGTHNVAIACLSAGELGIGSAAAIATEMRTTFPCLRFGLLVGVGGGVPSTADIRLGDIIVSQPRGGQEAVVQYDFGKTTTSGFQRTKRLNAPPAILLNALSNYQARNLDPDGDLVSHRFKPKKRHPMLQKFSGPDLLFHADYHHTGGTTCEDCDDAHLSKPADRDHRCIMIHYGTIASGNQVIKNGTTRDQLSRELGGVLCFEMEAAGIMNTFPSLVIRGVCDHADSHKNKDSQRFAALAAAAYGKDFLDIVPSVQPPLMVEGSEPVKSLKKFKHSKSSARLPKSTGPDTSWSGLSELVKYDFTIQSISDYNQLRVYREFARNRCPGTTQWILEHKTYLQWRASRHSNCLWLTGKIGSGKTLVTSTIIEQLVQEEEDNSRRLVLHYFCRHSYKEDLSAIAFLKSCIKQMLTHLELTGQRCPPDIELYLKHHCGLDKGSAHFNEMVEIAFIPLANMIDQVTLVVDGLDECDSKEIQEVLKLIRTFLRKPGKKVFLSGRASLDIVKSIPESLCIEISEVDAVHDISEYIRWKLEEKMLERQIVDDLEILAEIKATLMENAEQMILWVQLQIENIWEDCSGDADIRAALKDLPRDLTQTYDRCFERISSDKGIFSRGYAAKILPWMLEAVQPLTITQLRQALAINSNSGTIEYDDMPSVQDTIRSCANLILRKSDEQVVLTHHSVEQYLRNKIQAEEHEHSSTSTRYSATFKLSTTSTLGRLCIGHLSSTDYTLALQKVDKGATLRLDLPEINRLATAIPWPIRSFLPQPKPVQVTLPPPRPKFTAIATLPDFFHYAREQWPELTRSWSISEVNYPQFASLALQPNLTWRLHPWKPLGQSLESHYFGLLGWSIANRHEPLFKLLFPKSGTLVRNAIFAAPFHPYDGLNSVQLAARSNAPWAFDHIPWIALKGLLGTKDHKGWTVLHYAAEIQSKELAFKLIELWKILDVPFNGIDMSVLKVAAAKGHGQIVGDLLTVLGFENPRLLVQATIVAIQGCHTHLLVDEPYLEEVLEHGANGIEQALLDLVRNGRADVIETCLAFFLNNRQWSCFGRNWRHKILLAAIHFNQNVIFDSLIQECLGFRSFQGSRIEDLFVLLISKIIKTSNPDQYRGWFAMAEKLSNVIKHSQLKYMRLEPVDLLYYAIKNNTPYQVDILLQRSVNTSRCFSVGGTALQMALSAQKYDTVKVLLKYQTINEDNAAQFLEAAIRMDDMDLTKKLVKRETFPTLLHLAGMIGNDEIFKYLLDFSEDWQFLHIPDKHCGTLLILAAEYGYATKVELLCERLHGSSKDTYLNRRDTNGMTALYHGCINDHFVCSKVLLKYGAALGIPDSKGQTALHVIAQRASGLNILSSSEFTGLVDNKQIDLDVRNAQGETALHIAALNDDMSVITKLLDYGADINIQDDINGATALRNAALSGNQFVVRKLLESGAEANIRDRVRGATALHIAVWNEYPSTITALLEHGGNVNIQDSFYGATALHMAVQAGNPSLTEELLKRGADVNIRKSDRGATALHMAVQAGNQSHIDVLLAHGANVNIRKSDNGATALHMAVQAGNQSLTEELLKYGADVNVQTSNKGVTALHIAMQAGNQSLIDVLLEHGANVNIRRRDNGATALHIAAENTNEANAAL